MSMTPKWKIPAAKTQAILGSLCLLFTACTKNFEIKDLRFKEEDIFLVDAYAMQDRHPVVKIYSMAP